MKHFMGFTYDGMSSKAMGVTQVSTSGGLFEDDLMSSRTIETEKGKMSDITMLKRVIREPITFQMTLYLEDGMDQSAIDRITYWLDTDEYRQFYFDERDDRIVYALPQNEIKLSHDGINGYFNVTMVANSPYWHTPVVAMEYESPGEYMLINNGVSVIKPIIEIHATTNITAEQPFKIKNLRTNQEVIFKEIASGEVVTIDCEWENVESSLPNIYRYDAWNEEYVILPTGQNILQISSGAYVVIKYRERYR